MVMLDRRVNLASVWAVWVVLTGLGRWRDDVLDCRAIFASE